MDTVAKVKESDRILLQGNFETKAQSLAMRLAKRGCWRPSYSQSIISNDIQVYIIYIKES